jgi:hypothetical protein
MQTQKFGSVAETSYFCSVNSLPKSGAGKSYAYEKNQTNMFMYGYS